MIHSALFLVRETQRVLFAALCICSSFMSTARARDRATLIDDICRLVVIMMRTIRIGTSVRVTVTRRLDTVLLSRLLRLLSALNASVPFLRLNRLKLLVIVPPRTVLRDCNDSFSLCAFSWPSTQLQTI